jgi:hypothetical protein
MSNLLQEVINLNQEIYDDLPDSVIRKLVDRARSQSSSIPNTKSYNVSTRSEEDLDYIEGMKREGWPDIDWEDDSVSDEDKISQSINFAIEFGFGLAMGTFYCPWSAPRIRDVTGKGTPCIHQRFSDARLKLRKERNSYVTQ